MSDKVRLNIELDPAGVAMRFGESVDRVVLGAQDAFELGESLARAAHVFRFGDSAPAADVSYLAEQIRSRVTDQIRDLMIQRAALVLPQLIERKLSPGQAAVRIVDIVLNAAQGRVVT